MPFKDGEVATISKWAQLRDCTDYKTLNEVFGTSKVMGYPGGKLSNKQQHTPILIRQRHSSLLHHKKALEIHSQERIYTADTPPLGENHSYANLNKQT
jgi:hypothetical protein